MHLRRINAKSITRSAFGIIFFALGLFRLMAHRGFPGHPYLTFFNEFGLMILGLLLVLGLFTRFNKALYFLFSALIFEFLIEQQVISAANGQRISSLMVIFFLGYFAYRFFRITFIDARRDTANRKKGRASIGPLTKETLLPVDSPYHSHLENKAFLLRDMQKSRANSLVGFDGCFGTRWHFGPLWFENFFGDVEPPHGKDGPLRVVVWQPMRDVPASAGWRHTRLLKYNHLTGFATLAKDVPYDAAWSDHARRHVKKWRHSTEWEVYHPTPDALFRAYRKSTQNVLLKFYFVNLTKQLLLGHKDQLIFWGVRQKGTEGPMLAGFVCHDIPEAKQSRHLMSFIHPTAKSTPIGVGLMDEWFKYAIAQGFAFLDFGVFWMPGDPESWKGFSRFKGQFGITYVEYPRARLRRAGSWRNMRKFF